MAKMTNRTTRALALSAFIIGGMLTANTANAIGFLTKAQIDAVMSSSMTAQEKVELIQKFVSEEAPAPAPAAAPLTINKVEEAPKAEEKTAEVKAPVAEAPKAEEPYYWATGPRPKMFDECPVTLEKGVPSVSIPGTIEVRGEVKQISVGGDVGIIFPDRGKMLPVAKLAAKYVRVPEWRGDKVIVKKLATFTQWPKDKAYDFSSYTCLRDFLMMRPYGLIVTACGTGNIEEAVRGRPLDNPVRTVAVLENPELDAQGRIHGDRKIYAISRDGKTVPVSVQHYTDFDSVVYWIQMRVPACVLATKARQVHWRSAKYRAEGTVANDGTATEPQAFLTLFFGAQEGNERMVGGKIVGREGREATIPARPLVPISQAEAEAALAADAEAETGK